MQQKKLTEMVGAFVYFGHDLEYLVLGADLKFQFEKNENLVLEWFAGNDLLAETEPDIAPVSIRRYLPIIRMCCLNRRKQTKKTNNAVLRT